MRELQKLKVEFGFLPGPSDSKPTFSVPTPSLDFIKPLTLEAEAIESPPKLGSLSKNSECTTISPFSED